MAVAKYSHVGEVLQTRGTDTEGDGYAGSSFSEEDSENVLERFIKGGQLTGDRAAVSGREVTVEDPP